MAEVYDSIKGMKIEKAMAHQEDVQGDLGKRARTMGTKAEWLLAGHRHDGHARVVVEQGDIDFHIILDDDRGLRAAMSIEYGRTPNEQGRDAMRGTFVLHDATGLPR